MYKYLAQPGTLPNQKGGLLAIVLFVIANAEVLGRRFHSHIYQIPWKWHHSFLARRLHALLNGRAWSYLRIYP